jgi:hypothetical protein
MRAPELQPIAALIAGLLMVGAVGWWAFSQAELIDPGQPKWPGAKIDDLVAAVPTIDPFSAFYINDENPFVPYQQRLAESQRTRNVNPRPEPVVIKMKPLRPAVEVVEYTKPTLVLPKVAQAGPDAPIVYGFVGNTEEQTLLVRMPADENTRNMQVGEKARDWTLIAIRDNNVAHFTDPAGTERRFMIGVGDLASAKDKNESAQKSSDGGGNTNGDKSGNKNGEHTPEAGNKGPMVEPVPVPNPPKAQPKPPMKPQVPDPAHGPRPLPNPERMRTPERDPYRK